MQTNLNISCVSKKAENKKITSTVDFNVNIYLVQDEDEDVQDTSLTLMTPSRRPYKKNKLQNCQPTATIALPGASPRRYDGGVITVVRWSTLARQKILPRPLTLESCSRVFVVH